ncbi:MAG: hypothetical protein ACKO96_44720 [Flammeovirgaceae bacterium]
MKKLSLVIASALVPNSQASSLYESLTSIFGMQTLQELNLDDE